MYAWLCTCIYVHVYVKKVSGMEYTCIRTHMHTCMHTYIHTYKRTYMTGFFRRVYMHLNTYIHTYIKKFISYMTSMNVYIHTCRHTYTHAARTCSLRHRPIFGGKLCSRLSLRCCRKHTTSMKSYVYFWRQIMQQIVAKVLQRAYNKYEIVCVCMFVLPENMKQ